jgi:hypothetical protein
MGVGTLCNITVTGTVGAVDIGIVQVSVPSLGTGLVDATIPLPLGLGDLDLTNLPCPTLASIGIEIAGVLSLTISVTETPAP